MIQAGDRLRLSLEPLPQRLVLRVPIGQHLQGDLATQLAIGRAKDLAHAADRQRAGIAVARRQDLSGQRHGRAKKSLP